MHAKFREAVQQLAEVSDDFQQHGVSFLRSLLDPDPAKRLTAEGALSHPFLAKSFHGAALDNVPPGMKQEQDMTDTPDSSLDRRIQDACMEDSEDDEEDDEDNDDDDDDDDDDFFF